MKTTNFYHVCMLRVRKREGGIVRKETDVKMETKNSVEYKVTM